MSRSRRGREGGYVLPMSALLLVPMMIFAALAVDVGGWTVQANRAQAAADAAALAGAPLLPDQGAATTVARDIATLNGFAHGVDGVTVDVQFPDAVSVRVVVNTPGERYLSDLISTTPVDISRYAEATALSPVGIGSPTNVLGFGAYSLGGSPPANYWILENNDCQIGHYGDLKAAQYLASPWCGTGLGLPENPFWKRASTGRDGGYFFEVAIPPGVTTTSRLMIFDPGKCPGYGTKPADGHWNKGDDQGTRLRWRQWDTNATPLIADDDTPVSSWWESDECANDLPYPSNSWTDTTQGWTSTPFVFPPNTTGEVETHLVQSMVHDSTRLGWNHYSYWVRPDSGSATCSSIGVDTCPTISAVDWIPTRASGATAGDPMELFLADVGPEYAGRHMQVQLWDVGEGMDNIQVLDPLGNSLDFTWSSDDSVNHAPTNPSDTCSGNPCLWLDPGFSGYAPKLTNAGWGNHWRFNGRVMTLSVPLDTQVDFPAYAASGNGYWFSIRFQPTASKTAREWASFSVGMSGDPIRLTD
ncbi:MAG: pilus assembly protein TadG-related protein [Actinomycetota bacterium]